MLDLNKKWQVSFFTITENQSPDNLMSYNDWLATGDWVAKSDSNNLVSKDDPNRLMILHDGLWRSVSLD